MATIAFVIILLVIGAVVAVRWLKRRAGDMAGLMSSGETASATVVMAQRVRKSRTHKACRVRYAFVAKDGVEYAREIEVPPKEFGQFREGQAIDVVYDSGNPEVSMLASAVSAAREARNAQHAPR